MHKFKSNNSNCINKNDENICSSNGGTQEKQDTIKLNLPPKYIVKFFLNLC